MLVLGEVHGLEDGEDGQFLEEVARHLVAAWAWLGVGMTMPKSSGIALELRLHREGLHLLAGSQVMNAFWAGCRMSLSLAAK